MEQEKEIINEYFDIRMYWDKQRIITYLSNKYRVKISEVEKIVEENEVNI